MSTNSLKELVDAIKTRGKTLAEDTGSSAATSRDLVYLSTAAERLFGADAMLSMINEATKPAEVVSVGLATAATVTLTDEQVARTVVKITNSDSSNAQSGFVVVAPSKGVAVIIDNALPVPVTVKALNQTANIPSIAANSTGWVFCDGTNYAHVIDTAAIAQAVTTPMTTAGDMMYKEGVTSAAVVNHSVHVRLYGTESYYYVRPDLYNNTGFDSGYDKTPTFIMQPSVTYVFDVSDNSNTGQIFSFSTTADGTHASGADLASFDATSTVHVTRSGTEGSAGATVTVAMPATPNVTTLYYYSRGTDSSTLDTIGLGGQINVITTTAVTRLPIGSYGDTLGIDKFTGKPVWQNWGANENRKFASLQGDYTGIWSGGRYKFANHITEATGTLGGSTHSYAANTGTWDMGRTGWTTQNFSSAIVYNRGRLECSTWGHNSEGQTGKYNNGDYVWETNGYAKNGQGLGGFTMADNVKFSDAIQVINLYSTTMILHADGSVYVTGHGDEGQQVDGFNVDRNYFHKVPIPSGAGRCRYIASSSQSSTETANTMMLLMEDGDLYAWGYNVNGGMGDETVANKNTITHIDTFTKNVKSISCSGGNYNHCVVLTTDNRIFTWGGNNYGQCGQGNNTAIKQTPTEISVSGQTPVKAIASGGGSYGCTHVLMASGRVYACGRNNYGQLGLGNTTSTIYTLTQVGGGLGTDSGKHVIDVFPRGHHPENVFFLTEDGSLYATGQNNPGVQGRGNVTQTTTPLICNDKLKWVSEIYHAPAGSSAYYQMGFMCHANKEDRIARRNGWFYITGYGHYACGFYNFPSPISGPMSPAFPLGVNGTLIQANVHGYMGSSTSKSTSWEVLDENGDMYVWGEDSNGQTSGNEGNLYVPAKRI